MATKKNNIQYLNSNDSNLKTKIKERKRDFGKKSKEEYYQLSKNIINNYNDTISFKNNNVIRLNALKELVNNLDNSIDNEASYPGVNDLDLSYKLYHKKEFHQYKQKNTILGENLEQDIKKLSKKKCNFSGKRLLTDAQKLLKNYISPFTPYNGILIYHGVGVGKTCTAVSIAEGFKEIIRGNKKKIFVLVNPSIKDNFKKEILNDDLISKSINDAMSKCTGDSYFKDGVIEKGISRGKNVSRIVDNILSDYYDFYGYMGFVTHVNKIIGNVKNKFKSLRDQKALNKEIRKRLKEYFSDSMIIIDEAHNISNKSVEKTIKEVNMNSNNSRSLINNTKTIDGKLFTSVIKNVIRNADNLKLVLLTATPMYNEAYELLDLLNILLLNDNIPELKQKDIFDKENKLIETSIPLLRQRLNGYVSYLRSENPINFPYKIYPLEYENKFIKNELYPKLNRDGQVLGNRINHLNIIGCPMNGLQWEVYQKYYYVEQKKVSFDSSGSQLSNIVYGEDLDISNDDILSSSEHFGTSSFERAFRVTENKGNINIHINEGFEELLKLENLHKISCKINNFIQGLLKKIPDGIIFIYSQFLNTGVYSIALFLELIGVNNYNGSNILKSKRVDDLMYKGKPLRYILKTGNSRKDFQNYKNNDEINNMDGSLVKFILGTKAAAEGISIFNVREIHIFDPWFHLNRIEQINGRGIRNCSHKLLDLVNRNVSIYMYAAIEPENRRETIDLKMYKDSEKKAINMGKIQLIIKSSAMDCYLNKDGNTYLNYAWNNNIDITDSRGNKRKFNLADKPFTDSCNYSTEEKCPDFKCYSEGGVEKKVVEDKVDNSTYKKELSEKDIQYYQELVKDLFSNLEKKYTHIRVVFTLTDIKNYIKDNDKMLIDDKYREEIIYYALDEMINKNIEIEDIFKRKGRIINKNNYYIFQPLDLSDNIPITYRKLNYKKKINKVILKNLTINKTKKKQSVIKTIRKDDKMNDIFESFLRISLDNKYFYQENMESKKKDNIINDLDFLDIERFLKERIFIEYQYDHLSKNEREHMIKFLVLKINETEYNSEILSNTVNLGNLDRNIVTEYLKQKLLAENKLEDINEDKLLYLIKYCLFNHLEFNRQVGYETSMDINYLGYRIYTSITLSRKMESKLELFKLSDVKFVKTNPAEEIILGEYHDTYKMSIIKDRDLADIYGLYFCDRIKFKIVDNNIENTGDKRTLKPGVGCENSATTNRKLLIPLMKTLKDGDRLLDDKAKQKYKCFVMEIFFRYKEYLSQRKRGKVYFFNQGLHGLVEK